MQANPTPSSRKYLPSKYCVVTSFNVIPCTQGKYGFFTLGIIALKSFAKMYPNLGKTSSKRTVFVSINSDVVTAPTAENFPLYNPPPTVPPTETLN